MKITSKWRWPQRWRQPQKWRRAQKWRQPQDCILTMHTRRWTYSPLRLQYDLCRPSSVHIHFWVWLYCKVQLHFGFTFIVKVVLEYHRFLFNRGLLHNYQQRGALALTDPLQHHIPSKIKNGHQEYQNSRSGLEGDITPGFLGHSDQILQPHCFCQK